MLIKSPTIPLLSRILQVADAFDAMTSERPYRKIRGIDKAIEELKTCSGRQFDPATVNAFIRAFSKERNYNGYPDLSGRIKSSMTFDSKHSQRI